MMTVSNKHCDSFMHILELAVVNTEHLVNVVSHRHICPTVSTKFYHC